MQPIRVKVCQESDLRMLGLLARNIQRVLPVTQADIDAAAALGKGWVVWKVIEVSDPLDNLRGGTQLIIKQNSVQPGQNVRRVIFVSGPGGQTVVIRGSDYIVLPDAIADSLSYVKAFGGTEQRNLPDGYIERQFIYMMDGSYIEVEDLPISAGYRVEFDFQTLTLSSPLRNYLGGRVGGVSAGGGFRLSKLAASNNNRVVLYGFESGTEYYDPTTQFQANTRYKYTYNNGVCTLESGGSVVSTRTFTVTDNTSTNWGINTYGNGTHWQTDSDGIYVYSVKVWNDQGELVMDLVPAVQRGTVPVVGFYDAATGGFRTPTAGTFAAGPEATPTPDAPVDIVCNNGILKVKDSELPLGYKRLTGITYDSNTYYETNEKLYGSDTLTITVSGTSSSGRNVVGAYSGTGDDARNFSLYIYGAGSTSNSYLRHGTKSTRPRYGTGTRTLVIGPSGTDGFLNNVTYEEEDFETTSTFRIGTLPNSTSAKYDGNIVGNITVSDRLKYIPCERVSDGEIGYYETFTGTFLEPQGSGTPVSMGYDVSYMTEIYADGTVETIKDSLNNTATTEMLLKVGDYTDVQSILDGAITRKVGVKVFDGVSTGAKATAVNINTGKYYAVCGGQTNITATTTDLLSTHFKAGAFASGYDIVYSVATNIVFINSNQSLTTVDSYNQWLADQYNAGTPVIVVYPLATATTESVTGQTLQVQDGDNTLEITQASLTGLELEAEYEQGVEASVEEIEP